MTELAIPIRDGLPLRKFPSIEQFRHVVADVRHKAEYIGQDANNKPMYDAARPKPTLTFRGTVKLHGSNCGVVFDLERHTTATQSRERILSVAEDNFGFCAWAQSLDGAGDLEHLRALAVVLADTLASGPVVAIRVFGEWCGPEVNGKTGIGRLPRRWVVFSILATLADGTELWLPVSQLAAEWGATSYDSNAQVFFITNYPQYTIDIDFNAPDSVLTQLEALTLEVEAECPVAKAMGGGGIGEGIVWECRDPVYGHHTFKTKGGKHKGTKNAKLVQIEPEVMASLEAFLDAVVTESRLEQGFDILRATHGTVTKVHAGAFLKWIGQDVLKEEGDTMAASGLDRQMAMGRIKWPC